MTERVRWSRADTIAATVITVAAGALRLYRIGTPDRATFDENFYAPDACLYVKKALECARGNPVNTEHPPLGKWLIALGIEVFDYEVFGWRIAPVLAGTAAVLVVYLLARRLSGSTLAAAVAAGVLGIDFLHFTTSRIAMLDVFVTTFGVLAVYFAVLERDAMRSGRAGRWGSKWRLAAGVAAGAAVASKWSGLFVLLAVAGLVLVWDLSAGQGVRRSLLSIGVALVAVPAVVYVVSYLGRPLGTYAALPWADGSWIRGFVARHRFMLDFHLGLDGRYPWTSPGWSWPLVKRPVIFSFDDSGGRFREILATGNPAVWWPSLAAIAALTVSWLRRRDVWRPELPVVVAFVAAYAPWLVLTGQRSFSFIFYFAPAVPFLCIGLGMGVAALGRRGRAAATVAVAVAAIVPFAFFYPVLTASPLTPSEWERRILFDDCGEQATRTEDGHRRPADRPGPPPRGWCWV